MCYAIESHTGLTDICKSHMRSASLIPFPLYFFDTELFCPSLDGNVVQERCVAYSSTKVSFTFKVFLSARMLSLCMVTVGSSVPHPGPSLCWRRSGRWTSVLIRKQIQRTLNTNAISISENLVTWLQLAAREIGKCNSSLGKGKEGGTLFCSNGSRCYYQEEGENWHRKKTKSLP